MFFPDIFLADKKWEKLKYQKPQIMGLNCLYLSTFLRENQCHKQFLVNC